MAGQTRSAVRFFQALISLAFFAVLASIPLMAELVNGATAQSGPGSTWRMTPSFMVHSEGDVIKMKAILNPVSLMIAFFIYGICVLSFIWSLRSPSGMVYTADPAARARAHCCGNHAICASCTCEMALDIALTFLWACMLLLMATALAFLDATTRALISADNSSPLLGASSQDSEQYTPVVTTSTAYGADGSTATAQALVSSRPWLIACVVLAAVQLACSIVTAALSSAKRNLLRAEARCAEVFPLSAPKQFEGMEAGAKPRVGGFGGNIPLMKIATPPVE